MGTEHPLYERFEGPARSVKIALQMLIGCVIVLLLGYQLVLQLFALESFPLFTLLAEDNGHPLKIVGYGLAVSAGIELAHMLFTDGPDEAVEPLILGLASAILLVISKDDVVGFEIALTVALYIAGVGFLFWIRKLFVPPK